ncbi:MAG: hypothetical protein JW834_04060 [Candidatus Diapherotrites archaeon]|nr:hypothetical protein [Candidatus Diapherotrites archaeon]
MAQFKEQVHIREVPKDILLHAIESIAEVLAEDAAYNYGKEYGFYSKIDVKEDEGMVFCEIKFVPYDYRFRWLASKEKDGFIVTFIGSTPGGWTDLLTNAGEKLRSLMDTQWSAFNNFALGYVTAESFIAAKRKGPAKEHVKAAKAKVRKRTTHKKTIID